MTTATLQIQVLTALFLGLKGLYLLKNVNFRKYICRCVDLLDPEGKSRSKILLGMNMYGFDYTSQGGGHVLGRDLIEVCTIECQKMKSKQISLRC